MKIAQKLILTTVFLISCIISQSQIIHDNSSCGYQNGTLIIIGGGGYDDLIMEEFRKYAGSDSAKTWSTDPKPLARSAADIIKTSFK